MNGQALRGLALAGACLASASALSESAAAAEMDIKVRNHRGAQVIVRPIARSGDMIIVREFYEWQGERDTNSLYQLDCKKHQLRYVSWAEDQWRSNDKFYSGAYKAAHDRMCRDYKDPLEQYRP